MAGCDEDSAEGGIGPARRRHGRAFDKMAEFVDENIRPIRWALLSVGLGGAGLAVYSAGLVWMPSSSRP